MQQTTCDHPHQHEDCLYLGTGVDFASLNLLPNKLTTYILVDALPNPGKVYGYDTAGQEVTFMKELEDAAEIWIGSARLQ